MRKPLDGYEAIFFDAGDTLLSIPGTRAILKEYLSGRGLDCREEEIGECFEEAYRRLYYGKLSAAAFCTPESDRLFWAGLYRHMLEGLGAPARWGEEQLKRCCHELYDLFTSPEHYQLFGDVPDCLEELSGRGIKLGIISNFAPTLERILEDRGIRRYFDPVIVSTLVGLEKPDPAIFRLALERTGLDPGRVLYVGDHDLNDLWAPAQVGIDAVKIKRYAYHTGEGICSLRELLPTGDDCRKG